ncbi:hypothetical protein Hamer_G009480 [Homarus americanus]|uniref:Uncharacterized protein n=1 Tax=Homarus americanus TaxID=6706 RepID=A0A8J5J5N9_HOMAM|nr:hypothetical protein Hamer_G009480 [Homarus americanus]
MIEESPGHVLTEYLLYLLHNVGNGPPSVFLLCLPPCLWTILVNLSFRSTTPQFTLILSVPHLQSLQCFLPPVLLTSDVAFG